MFLQQRYVLCVFNVLGVMLYQVFAEYEPNMPRVAGRGRPEPDRKSIVRSASAVSITQGRAKVRQLGTKEATK